MFNKLYIKISILILALFIVVTIVFVKNDGSQSSNLSSLENTDSLNEKAKKEADSTKALEYFSVFKFVNNFNPSK